MGYFKESELIRDSSLSFEDEDSLFGEEPTSTNVNTFFSSNISMVTK
jgi:hypothetical protein